MVKTKRKRAAGDLADAWIECSQMEGITRVVSCHWSYMCWCRFEEEHCLPWCPGGPRELVTLWGANGNLLVSLTAVELWLLVPNHFMVTTWNIHRLCRGASSIVVFSSEAVHCPLSRFLGKTLRNSIWWFGWNRISKQGKWSSSGLWFLVLWCPWGILHQETVTSCAKGQQTRKGCPTGRFTYS